MSHQRFPKTREGKHTMHTATSVQVVWSSHLVSVDPRWVLLWWHRRAIDAEGACAHISRCGRIERWGVLEALSLLDVVVESSGLLHKPLHLLGGEGKPGHIAVIALPLMEPSVEFGSEVKRVAGEVEHVTEVFTMTVLAMEGMVERDI